MTAKNKKNKKAQNLQGFLKELIPLGKSFALWGVTVVIVALDYIHNQWFSLLFIDFTTHLLHWLSFLFSISAEIGDKATTTITTLEVIYRPVTINGYSMIVELECSAYHAYLALISLVAFSRWTIKQKIIQGTIMFLSLAIINSIRIIGLGLIGKQHPQFFDIFHDYFWNILIVIIIWGMWEFVNQKLIKKNNTINQKS